MTWVADSSAVHPTVATLKAAGASGTMRYCSPGRNDGTNITAEEIADFTANNFPYGLVCEYEANWLLRGYQFGHDTAVASLALEASLGIPRGVMYLACDYNASASDFPTLLATMQGWADGYGGWQYVRPYGSKAFCEWVQANSPARGSWSTYAWSFNPSLNRFEHAADARLWQYNFWPIAPVQGCDFNEVLGDWGPRTGTTDWFDMASKDDLLAVVRQALNEGTGTGQTTWAGTNKALLATCQGLMNYVKVLVGASNIITTGGNGHQGLDQIAAMLEGVQSGTVDPAALETAVNNAVHTALANLTLKASA